MLKNLHTGKLTRHNAHGEGFNIFRSRIGEEKYQAICDWIKDELQKGEWINTTFVAPTDWTNTPLEEIWKYYHKIQDHDERYRQSAIHYGALFYTVVFDLPEIYIFHRPEGHHSDDSTPFGLTYRRES